jgi:hypothetical protein
LLEKRKRVSKMYVEGGKKAKVGAGSKCVGNSCVYSHLECGAHFLNGFGFLLSVSLISCHILAQFT